MALSHDPLGPGYKEKSLQWIKVSNIFQAPSLEKTPCQKDGGGVGIQPEKIDKNP